MAVRRGSRSAVSSFGSEGLAGLLAPAVMAPAALLSTMLASCSYEAPDIVGRRCPCPSGYECVADRCQLPAGGSDASVGEGDAPTRELAYTASTELVLNPERGFFAGIPLLDVTDVNYLATEYGIRLAYDLIDLSAYREVDELPAVLLDDIEGGLDLLRRAGASAILRFAYNETDTGPDAPLARILRHIEQLAGVLSRNVDVIAVLEAGFIGAYGEWRDSTNNNLGSVQQRAVVEALLEAVPERAVLVRRPELKNEMYGEPVDASRAYGDTPVARVGHHNECLLGGADDGGTFAGSVERWRDYQSRDSRFVPVGGAMCGTDATRWTCAEAISEMETFHWTFLASDYPTDALAALDSGGCLDDIRARLGYRFELTTARLPEAIQPGGSFPLAVRFRNRGFAAPMNRRDVLLVIEGEGQRLSVPLPGTDVRRYGPGDHAIDARVRLPASLAAGEYRAALWIPSRVVEIENRSEYAIRFASLGPDGEDVWEVGLNVLGTFEVRPDAPGESDPEADELAILD